MARKLTELTDELGPRLSVGLRSRRALGRRALSLRALTVEMVAPRYMPLIGYAEAWSPPTSGVLTGAPVYIGDTTESRCYSIKCRCGRPALRRLEPLAALRRGMLADIVMLATGVFAKQPAKAEDVAVMMTIFDGRIVFRSP